MIETTVGRLSSRHVLTIGALGVVYGDIGTSPLYAFRESLTAGDGVAVNETNVLGILSLMVWALLIVVTFKYLVLVMRADNHGEGGILALTALILPRTRAVWVHRVGFVVIGLFGTALLYGDGMITPAISVLSAVEGVGVAAPTLGSWIVPLSIVVLLALFSLQRLGTGRVGALFGPAMVIWFGTLALLGGLSVLKDPRVLRAISPWYAVQFFGANGFRGFLVLGSVFLVVTGGEALYADLGHFGRSPITRGWFSVVLPALLLNYFGQGALLLRSPESIENPFFLLAPGWGYWALVALATVASVIASQALISGAFSLTKQAINLDYAPRFRVVHTSDTERGQVYVPFVNWVLMVAAIGLVVAFGSSSGLAAAYGVAVTMTMLITTILLFMVMRLRWDWSVRKSLLTTTPIIAVDLAFLGANVFKIPQGGWFPLVIGFVVFSLMVTWRTGRLATREGFKPYRVKLSKYLASLEGHPPERVPGTAVYLHRRSGVVPPALLANLHTFHVLHEEIVILTIEVSEDAHVPPAARASIRHRSLDFHQLQLHYGFADEIDVPCDLQNVIDSQVSFDPDHTTFFLAQETWQPSSVQWWGRLRDKLFVVLHRNARNPADAFHLPPDRTMGVATRLPISHE